MIFQQFDEYKSHTVVNFHGRVGNAELYDTTHKGLERGESAFVFDMGCERYSETWNYPKRVAKMLGGGMPNHPVRHTPDWISREVAPRLIFILNVARVEPAVPQPVEGTPEMAAKCVAQKIRSIAGMHARGFAHGSVGGPCWRVATAGSLVLIDFGLMYPVAGESGNSDLGRSLMERDVRDVANLGLGFLQKAEINKRSEMYQILYNATCRGFGGRFPSAVLLFEAFADAAASVVRVDRGESPIDPLRLSPEQVRYLLQEFTRQSLAAFRIAPAGLP